MSLCEECGEKESVIFYGGERLCGDCYAKVKETELDETSTELDD